MGSLFKNSLKCTIFEKQNNTEWQVKQEYEHIVTSHLKHESNLVSNIFKQHNTALLKNKCIFIQGFIF